MLIEPGVEVKPVEADAAVADRDLDHVRAHVAVEYAVGHAEVGGCVAVAKDAWGDHGLV